LSFLESRAHAAEGDIRAALAAIECAGPPPTQDTAVALAQVWLAAGDHQAARRALDSVPDDDSSTTAEEARLEGWLVDARLRYETGDAARGRQSLEHALLLGKPEQLRLPFALEQAWIRPVLRQDPDLARTYRHLLEPGLESAAVAVAPATQAVPGLGAPVVVERLSEREQ